MHSISGKLNKDATQFQAGESIGFGIRLGVKYRDPKTKESEWTNYSAVIFAKSPNQIQFYQNVLVAGSIVSIGAEQLKVDSFEGQNGTLLSISMLNARLTYAFNPSEAGQQPPAQQQGGYGQAAQQQAQPQQQQQAPQRPQQQAAQSSYQNVPHATQGQQQGIDQFDDDIPF